MLPRVSIKEKSIDSALFLSPPSNWKDVVVAMKPGAHLLLFNNVKNHHLSAIAAEDNGLEIRDTLAYVYSLGENDTSIKLIAMARKPLERTVAENVLKWGTGGLNIDKCRVEHVTVEGGNLALNPHLRSHINGGNGGHIISTETERRVVKPHSEGRWPANLTHDGSAKITELFPEAKAGASVKGTEPSSVTNGIYGEFNGRVSFGSYGDNGSASRFFYSAPTLNTLIEYLLKLITPPGGTVLTSPQDLDIVEKAAKGKGFIVLGQDG